MRCMTGLLFFLVLLLQQQKDVAAVAGDVGYPESEPGSAGFGSTDQPGFPSNISGRGSVTVAQDGTGDFMSIQQAINTSRDNTSINDGYLNICIGGGVYYEYVVIPRTKKYIRLIGAGVDSTVITGNHSHGDGFKTDASATFTVEGEGFIATDITFENSASPEKLQAVAVRNKADRSVFHRCRFVGHQDTLYVHHQRQFYRECDVYGTIDFIFGDAAAVFQNCNIFALEPLVNQSIIITAQGRKNQSAPRTGISIHNCTIDAAPYQNFRAAPAGTLSYLGRPWKEYSTTVYMQSFVSSLVQPEGWTVWNNTFAPNKTLFYGEYQNYGPGADTSHRVQWEGYHQMNTTQALTYTVSKFINEDGWLNHTGVPYIAELL